MSSETKMAFFNERLIVSQIPKKQRFKLFWANGFYSGGGFCSWKKLLSRFYCWNNRHSFLIPFSVKTTDFKTIEITLKCQHCGYQKEFTRDLEKLHV